MTSGRYTASEGQDPSADGTDVALAERFSWTLWGLAGAGGSAYKVTHLTGWGEKATFSWLLVPGRRPVHFHTTFSMRLTGVSDAWYQLHQGGWTRRQRAVTTRTAMANSCRILSSLSHSRRTELWATSNESGRTFKLHFKVLSFKCILPCYWYSLFDEISVLCFPLIL